MTDQQVEIKVRQNGTSEVRVDGHDLTGVVRGLDVTAYAGHPPEVTLRLVPAAVTLDLDGADVSSLLSINVRAASPDEMGRALQDPDFRNELKAAVEDTLEQIEAVEQLQGDLQEGET